MAKRYDFQNLVVGKNVKVTPQGFLVIPAFTARTGTQKYKQADGSVIVEHRPEDEVFSESSMASLRTAVVTDGHPKDMVNPDNVQELMVGHTDGVIVKEQDGDEKFLKTHLVITHKKAIDAIRAGKAQLSNGYHLDLDFTPGEHNGQRYDAVQRNIVNNHIAIVWNARAGEKASLRLDEKDAILLNENDNNNEVKTMKIKIGEKEFDVADEIGQAIEEERKKTKKDHTDSIEQIQAEKEVLSSQKSGLVAKVDSLESDLEKAKTPKMDESEVEKRVKERISVLDSGKKILDAETVKNLDSMSDSEIKKAIIKADSPSVDESKLEDEAYTNARYDHICENFQESTKKNQEVGKKVAESRENQDGKDEYVSPEQKRLDNMEKERQASLAPIGVMHVQKLQ